jgi:hypothetical protein
MTIDIKEAPHTRRGPRAGVPKTTRAAAIERFGQKWLSETGFLVIR